MANHSAGAYSRTDSFDLLTALGSVRVETELAGVRDALAEECAPLFRVAPPSAFRGAPAGAGVGPGLTVRVGVVSRLDVPDDLADHLAQTPVLDLDASRYHIVEFGRRFLLWSAGDAVAAAMTVRGVRGGRVVQVDVAGASPGAVRAVVRWLRFAAAARMTAADLPALHGSAVGHDGRAVLMLGDRGSGKSTLMMLATTLAGCDFVTDDVVLPYRDPADGTVRVTGLPKRIGVSVAALEGHPARERFERTPLRHHGGPYGPLAVDPDRAWGAEHRVRVHCDVGEFLALTGARAVGGVAPAGVVLPCARREMRGWLIEGPAGGDASWLPRHRASTRQLKYVTDFLGLLPDDTPAGSGDVTAALAALPVVRVTYGPDVNVDFARFWDDVTSALAAATPVGVAR
ncbi:hypothetical protein ACGFZL_12990 [Streptomyces sp. NPDC048182]|uniref:hypothetical protein n=1 Tax=Streptomyces sp. NPDC048182 TaxID=3365507 RepID=UPI00371C0708